jgi:hypothetical protein
VISHAQWLGQLRAVGNLGPLGRLIESLNALMGLAVTSTVRAGAHAGRRIPWPWLVVGALAAAGAFRFAVSAEIRAKVISALGTGLATAAITSTTLSTAHAEAQEQFAALDPEQANWDTVTEVRGSQATLTRACLHQLARSPQSDLNAIELAEPLRQVPGSFPRGTAKVRSALRATAAFTEPRRGRFQVGRPAIPVGAR